MHDQIFAGPLMRDLTTLTAAAVSVGVDANSFRSCMKNESYGTELLRAIEAMRELGVTSTPTMLIGMTPRTGQPLIVRRYVAGAQPFIAFKAAIDMTLLDVR